MAREPGYCLHKPTGQAYVNLGGKVVYLGQHGTDDSKERYSRIKAEWLVNRHSAKFTTNSSGPSLAEVCLGYLDYAEVYYRRATEFQNIRLAVKPVSELYSTLPAKSFGPIEFKTIRDWWLQRSSNRQKGKCSRQYINRQMKRLQRMMKWAVGEAMIPPNIHEALRCVAPLKRGRSTAPEADQILPIEADVVAKTLPALTRVVADMVRFQLLVGCRPGEVVKLKPGMVDRSGEVWTITLDDHKTAYRGKQRTIYVGPQAQAILSPYLLRGAESFCFSPIESERQRLQAKHEARVTPLSCGNRPGSNIQRKPRREPGECYSAMTYARAIAYGCDRAFPAPKNATAEQKKAWRAKHRWAPNRLRHSAATEIRKRFGLEAASVILGHSELGVTQVYAESDRQKAVEVARQIG